MVFYVTTRLFLNPLSTVSLTIPVLTATNSVRNALSFVFSLGNLSGGKTEALGVRKIKGFLLFVAQRPSLYCHRSDCSKDKVPA